MPPLGLCIAMTPERMPCIRVRSAPVTMLPVPSEEPRGSSAMMNTTRPAARAFVTQSCRSATAFCTEKAVVPSAPAAVRVLPPMSLVPPRIRMEPAPEAVQVDRNASMRPVRPAALPEVGVVGAVVSPPMPPLRWTGKRARPRDCRWMCSWMPMILVCR